MQGPTTSLPAGVTPAAVPSTYKFGFAASTGLFTDVHLIRNVSVHPAAALPQLNLVKQVSAASDVPLPLTPGQQVPYEYVVTNSGNTTLTDVNVTDDRVTGICCPGTTLTSGQTMTCTGTYTVTEADGLAGSVTNTALAHGTTPGGTMVDSPPSEVTLPVQRGPGLRLEKTVDEDRVYRAGDEVSYTYTVTNTGPTELTGIGVTDDRVDGITCQATTLAAGGEHHLHRYLHRDAAGRRARQCHQHRLRARAVRRYHGGVPAGHRTRGRRHQQAGPQGREVRRRLPPVQGR
ncbi:hypothetical protein ACIOYT_21160 [Streptomyces halstedii]|uniref:DUF7507 domain-containing protein n=1 Tax=Streptomyces halstedii TaxID=1944 RepID=UPI003809852F